VGSRTEKHLAFAFAAESKVAANNEMFAREADLNTFSFPPLSENGVDLDSIQESLEKYYIGQALKLAKRNESRAAKLLNINHHTFRYRRKKLQAG
jgi:transcriptional regulator with PAS, ATPase and Fis domain